MNLQIYTNKGAFLGVVDNILLDFGNGEISALFVETPNPSLVEGSRAVLIPYRWVQSAGDIVVLRYFPGRIGMSPEERQATLFERQGIPEFED